jgi:hypothetical protein
MADKRRFTVSLPDHVADAIDRFAAPLGATPTEYACDVIRWWFGQGCPPVTHDEIALRNDTAAKSLLERIKPLPANLNVWELNPNGLYSITDDGVVQKLLNQLGVPNLFAQAVEHDEVRLSVAFDNHPTHWLLIDFYKGSSDPKGDGLSFNAFPKATTSREAMIKKFQSELKRMGSTKPAVFSQIPLLEKKGIGNPTPTKVKT